MKGRVVENARYCLKMIITATYITEGPMDWEEISANVSDRNCEYGMNYANQITARYYDFPPD